jgi:hypothetical protein
MVLPNWIHQARESVLSFALFFSFRSLWRSACAIAITRLVTLRLR